MRMYCCSFKNVKKITFLYYINVRHVCRDRMQFSVLTPVSVNAMNGEDASPVENAKRKAAANAFLNLSKKSSSKMKRVRTILNISCSNGFLDYYWLPCWCLISVFMAEFCFCVCLFVKRWIPSLLLGFLRLVSWRNNNWEEDALMMSQEGCNCERRAVPSLLLYTPLEIVFQEQSYVSDPVSIQDAILDFIQRSDWQITVLALTQFIFYTRHTGIGMVGTELWLLELTCVTLGL